MTEFEQKIKEFIDNLYQRKLLWYMVEGFDADMIITYKNELEAIEMINDFLQVLPYTSIDEATRLQLVRQMKEIQDYFGTDLTMSRKSISPYYSYRERFLSFSSGEEKEDSGIITPELLKRLTSIRFPDDDIDLLWGFSRTAWIAIAMPALLRKNFNPHMTLHSRYGRCCRSPMTQHSMTGCGILTTQSASMRNY